MTVTTAEIDSAIPTAGTPSRSLTNALLKKLVAEQQADFRVTVAGRYYPITDAPMSTSSAPSLNTIYFTPFVIRESTSISALTVRLNTGAASGEIQLAVYASSPTTIFPEGSPLAATGVLSATVAAVLEGSVTPATLAPGIYYFALMGNDTTLRWSSISGNAGNAISDLVGMPSAASLYANASNTSVSVNASNTYGTWPTNPTIGTGGTTSVLMPFGGYRVTP